MLILPSLSISEERLSTVSSAVKDKSPTALISEPCLTPALFWLVIFFAEIVPLPPIAKSPSSLRKSPMLLIVRFLVTKILPRFLFVKLFEVVITAFLPTPKYALSWFVRLPKSASRLPCTSTLALLFCRLLAVIFASLPVCKLARLLFSSIPAFISPSPKT